MKKLINKIIIKRRHIIVDAEDVLHALSVIQSHHSVVPEMKVGNCGWAESNTLRVFKRKMGTNKTRIRGCKSI